MSPDKGHNLASSVSTSRRPTPLHPLHPVLERVSSGVRKYISSAPAVPPILVVALLTAARTLYFTVSEADIKRM